MNDERTGKYLTSGTYTWSSVSQMFCVGLPCNDHNTLTFDGNIWYLLNNVIIIKTKIHIPPCLGNFRRFFDYLVCLIFLLCQTVISFGFSNYWIERT